MVEKSINLAFLRYPYSSKDGWSHNLQKYACRYVVGRFDHVEIIFENRDFPDFIYASSVLHDGTVFFKEKRFSREGYEYLTVNGLKPEQVNRMKNFCFKEATRKSHFNELGVYLAATPLPDRRKPSKSRPNQWFCSQLVTIALQEGGLLEGYIAGAMTPAAIYDAIVKTVPANHLHKGTNPFFAHRIQKSLKNETKRLLTGQVEKATGKPKGKKTTGKGKSNQPYLSESNSLFQRLFARETADVEEEKVSILRR